VPVFDAMAPAVAKVKTCLKAAGIEVAHFDGVTPNPTVSSLTAGPRRPVPAAPTSS
jgi:alcohol dehydrogenase class IV